MPVDGSLYRRCRDRSVFPKRFWLSWPGYGWDDTARALGLGPTVFAYDISRMIAGVLFMGAAGYGLMRGVHIRADFLYRGWSNKTQATVDATLYMAFFIPSMLFFTIIAVQYWEIAYRTGETAFDSPWEPLLWPARLAMPVGGLLLLLQGFPELFRAFHKMGKDRERYFVRRVAGVFLSPYFGLSWQCSIQMRRQRANGLMISCLRVQGCPNPQLV